jgi:hypothetical protein
VQRVEGCIVEVTPPLVLDRHARILARTHSGTVRNRLRGDENLGGVFPTRSAEQPRPGPGGCGRCSHRPVLLLDVLPDHGERCTADGPGEVRTRPELVRPPIVA